jgi:hypothetical protein
MKTTSLSWLLHRSMIGPGCPAKLTVTDAIDAVEVLIPDTQL